MVSTPGSPKGIFQKSPFHSAFCSVVKVQVSVAMTCTDPSANPCQSLALSSVF